MKHLILFWQQNNTLAALTTDQVRVKTDDSGEYLSSSLTALTLQLL